MEFIFGLFTVAVYAAELILSPIPDPPKIPVNQIEILETQAVNLNDIQQLQQDEHDAVGNNYAPLISPTIVPTSSATPVASPPVQTPIPSPIVISNPPRETPSVSKTYKIAVLGDSMIDTLGPMDEIRQQLKNQYPHADFTISNYGVGASNIDYGIFRLTHEYEYLGRRIPALSSVMPDIVIIESFGYNPFPEGEKELDRQWLAIANCINQIKSVMPDTKIILAATIAPHTETFGDGAPGISFSYQDKISRTNTIKKYIENMIAFARSQQFPLADAYHESLDGGGDGQIRYVNNGDHIHYSPEGSRLMQTKIAQAIIDTGYVK